LSAAVVSKSLGKSTRPAYGLSNAEKRDLIALIQAGKPLEFEERWTGGYVFENEWQSFRTRRNRELELITAEHTYDRPGRYTVAVKVIDIFGNDTMTLVPVNVG
jgi:site-specific DNA-methyltransferase (adenine-specific)/adenine-specific DNA-methyltransferase